jgi:hypothetical protein
LADLPSSWQVRALSAMLLARSQRQVDTERVAAFAKRLAGVRVVCCALAHVPFDGL